MSIRLNRARETTNVIGTGNATLLGAAQDCFTLYSSANSQLSTTFSYVIEHPGTGQVELGRGYLLDSTTLVRVTVIKSSNSNNLVSFTPGTKNVLGTFLGEDLGDASDKNFIFNQTAASANWTIAHLLGKRPSVSIVDTSGNEIFANINHVDDNNLTISFSTAISGKAYLN